MRALYMSTKERSCKSAAAAVVAVGGCPATRPCSEPSSYRDWVMKQDCGSWLSGSPEWCAAAVLESGRGAEI